MNFADKYNKKGSVFTFKREEGAEVKYINAEKLVQSKKVAVLHGFYYATKSKFPAYVGFLDGNVNINFPTHMNDTLKEIEADAEAVKAINAGQVGIKGEPYTKDGKTYYSITFVDLQPADELPF